MALNKNNHEFVNNFLYVDRVKFHRSKFIKETWVQHWDCSSKKSKYSMYTYISIYLYTRADTGGG